MWERLAGFGGEHVIRGRLVQQPCARYRRRTLEREGSQSREDFFGFIRCLRRCHELVALMEKGLTQVARGYKDGLLVGPRGLQNKPTRYEDQIATPLELAKLYL